MATSPTAADDTRKTGRSERESVVFAEENSLKGPDYGESGLAEDKLKGPDMDHSSLAEDKQLKGPDLNHDRLISDVSLKGSIATNSPIKTKKDGASLV
mmetsp:Transcript_2467/g.3705  ORF Transcript_2467/g.3705 Transcript_2467/m.3705 type:complete len:98 (+) Transcript_2467:132-425(+)|eukprot:CAMPEP_0172606512 /NCGR_PEP_ID=MMETSP1068-20121228/26722_1 /TAXON_ID=35684 /ORGANISM="Pseudopedinella elastica, Strain CCMP716" /LENGTH=97 /DNA_ID=CAMNT_0013409239 /DNA_START=80 /DNA_END=373 /DNA_ORIENTATION=+